MRLLAGLLAFAATLVIFLVFATDAPRDAGLAPPMRQEGAAAVPDALALDSGATTTTATATGQPAVTATAQRSLNARSRQPLSIRGRVLRASGEPAVRAVVGLFAPAARDDGPESPFVAATSAPPPIRDPLRVVRTWTSTDESGRFEFEDPDPGTWIVRAEDGPLLAVATDPFTCAIGAAPQPLELALPPEAWLEGNVILPPGASLEDVCLDLRANAEFSIARWMGIDSVRTQPGTDGRFRLGPVETGLFTVGLVIDPGLARRGRPDPQVGSVVPILDLYLPAGVTQRDVDVRAGLPGAIALRIELDGFQPTPVDPGNRRSVAETVRVLAVPLDPSGKIQSVGVSGSRLNELRVGPLAPGTWRLSAYFPGEGPWAWPIDPPVVVAPGQLVEVAAQLAVARASIEVVDAQTGLPLKGFIEVGTGDASRLEVIPYEVRPGGALTLTLPPGEYMVTAREEGLEAVVDDPRAWARLVWSGSGPTTSRLPVPR